jgi:hypothetical protein
MKDFVYYRCSGSDGYRFGGDAICNNKQVQGKLLETAVWHEVCELLTNPQKLERDDPGLNQADASFENIETLKSQRVKLQHALERLIDGFTEGLIEKDQFTARMDRTKHRIADLDTKIREDASDVDRREICNLQRIVFANWPPLSAQSWQVPAGIADGRLSGHSSPELIQTRRSSGLFPRNPGPEARVLIQLWSHCLALNDLDTLWTIFVLATLVQKIVGVRSDFAVCACLE